LKKTALRSFSIHEFLWWYNLSINNLIQNNMKTITYSFPSIILAALAMFAVLALPFTSFAATDWEAANGPTALVFTCGGGEYPHTINTISQSETGALTGTGDYDPNAGYTWNLTGQVTGDNVTLVITYTGISSGSVYNLAGVIATNGSVSGTSDSNCQTFTMPAGSFVEDVVEPPFVATLVITEPGLNEVVSGVVDFGAIYTDEDGNDNIQWAVRAGTCSAGTGTVAGNVDGFNTPFSWNHETLSTSIDMTSFAPGSYCFVVNPTEDSGDTNLRATRNFTLEEVVVTPTDPIEKNECKKGGWEDFGFKNQGQCVRFVETGKDSR
jgi:hypothetical protein